MTRKQFEESIKEEILIGESILGQLKSLQVSPGVMLESSFTIVPDTIDEDAKQQITNRIREWEYAISMMLKLPFCKSFRDIIKDFEISTPEYWMHFKTHFYL
ncbi:MAG: hypothetical protein LUC26_02735 [Prevotella sp.]|nr:hypothetical protein [Prevotella sp.]